MSHATVKDLILADEFHWQYNLDRLLRIAYESRDVITQKNLQILAFDLQRDFFELFRAANLDTCNVSTGPPNWRWPRRRHVTPPPRRAASRSPSPMRRPIPRAEGPRRPTASHQRPPLPPRALSPRTRAALFGPRRSPATLRHPQRGAAAPSPFMCRNHHAANLPHGDRRSTHAAPTHAVQRSGRAPQPRHATPQQPPAAAGRRSPTTTQARPALPGRSARPPCPAQPPAAPQGPHARPAGPHDTRAHLPMRTTRRSPFPPPAEHRERPARSRSADAPSP